MKEYEISVPIVGVARVTVTASSPEAAINEALEIAKLDDVDEWFSLPAVVEGNVFYGPINRVRIDDEWDIDD